MPIPKLPAVVIASLALWIAVGDLAEAAVIEGVIKLPEKARERRRISRYSGLQHGFMGERPDPIGVVFLLGPGLARNLRPSRETMRQQDLQFYPYVLPVVLGSEVDFPNLDETYHNVFSYSPNKTFDLGRYKRGDEPPVVTFDQPGEVRVFCEVHDHMQATILVLPTPYFVATDTLGRYRLEDVPAGDYTLHAWIGPGKYLKKSISLEPDTVLTINYSGPSRHDDAEERSERRRR